MTSVPRAPRPTAGELLGAARALAKKGRHAARPDALDARDPAFIEAVLPLMSWIYDDYCRCETELEAPLPDGPFLAVGNHNAMTGMPDMFCHMVAFWRIAGTGRTAYGLMHDVPFQVPLAGAWLNACGAIRATPDNADRALSSGAGLLVFPGGDVDACKPFSQRYRIDFGGRRGFVRAALRQRVPVVPVVSAGANEGLLVLSDGRWIAERLGLPRRVRSNVAPIGLCLPWGLIVGVPYPHLPLPVKIHTRILAPMTFDLPSSAADDPVIVERVHDEIVLAMRTAMGQLRQAGRHGLFPHS